MRLPAAARGPALASAVWCSVSAALWGAACAADLPQPGTQDEAPVGGGAERGGAGTARGPGGGAGGTEVTTGAGGGTADPGAAAADARGAASGSGAGDGAAGLGASDAGAGSTDPARFAVPRGPSAGCGMAPPSTDSATRFAKHDLQVSGVDPAFIAAHPAARNLAPYDWTHRNYFLKLPARYDPKKPYPVLFGGGGCGNTDGLSGQNGGFTFLPSSQDAAILIGMSYVYPTNAGACFTDEYANTPEVPYFDAVLAEVQARYCVDRGRVFMGGYSSGAWESFTVGCARAGVIRAIGTAAGGLRPERPRCSGLPMAAIMVGSTNDTANPIKRIDPKTGFDSGSGAARDSILKQNGCVGTETAPWDPAYSACRLYKGCPAAFPVVWCEITDGHSAGGTISATGFWKFWSALPPVP